MRRLVIWPPRSSTPATSSSLPKAAGSGKSYPSGLSEAFFATYDKNGNLFVDGFNNSGVGVVEFGRAAYRLLAPVSLSNTIGFPGNIQWDGKYVTVNDQDAFELYKIIPSVDSARHAERNGLARRLIRLDKNSMAETVVLARECRCRKRQGLQISGGRLADRNPHREFRGTG